MRYFSTIILLTISTIIIAQNVAFKKKNFEDQEGFKVAQKNLKEGNKKYIAKSYSDALTYFIKANEFNPNNADLNFKIGISYLKSEEPEKSLEYFQKAEKLDSKVHPLLKFGLGQAKQYNKQYEDAIKYYNEFLAGLSSAEKGNYEEKVSMKIKECEAAGGKNTVTDAPKNEEPKKEEKVEIKQEPAKDVAITETPEPFDPNKKEEYKPVNAHPVNTEIEKTPEKTKAVEKKNTYVKSETPVVKSEPIIKNKIENKDSNITYKIQISSSSRKLTKAEKNKLYNGTVKFEEDIVNGYYKYLLGNFKTKDEANKFRSKIGIKGAFIVKYKLGKRL